MKKSFILLLICFLPLFSLSQVKRVLFLGNSYTFVNNLPMLITGLAWSAGDSLHTDSNTPGGYTLGWDPIAHSTDAVSLEKIRYGNWDFVVLQEQSQTPAIPALRDSCMFPASLKLFDSVRKYNPCGNILFYLTWGRRFGGIQCFVPNYCSKYFADFGEMQDSVSTAYKLISGYLDQPVAPAGEAWRAVLDNTSMVLHDNDDSHPNQNGSYLTACVFFSSIFKKPSSGLTFTAGLLPDTALILQHFADSIVFADPAYWNLWKYDPVADYSFSVSSDTLFTHNLSSNSIFYQWDFGDGNFSGESDPVHVYDQDGTYHVILRSCDSCNCDNAMKTVSVGTTSSGNINERGIIRMAGPDRSGNIWFMNYSGNGILTVTDLNGRIVSELPVFSGKANVKFLAEGIYVWRMNGSKGKMIIH